MVIDVVVGTVWWCECGKTIRASTGAAQMVREHGWGCSYAYRRGRKLTEQWVTGFTFRMSTDGGLAAKKYPHTA